MIFPTGSNKHNDDNNVSAFDFNRTKHNDNSGKAPSLPTEVGMGLNVGHGPSSALQTFHRTRIKSNVRRNITISRCNFVAHCIRNGRADITVSNHGNRVICCGRPNGVNNGFSSDSLVDATVRNSENVITDTERNSCGFMGARGFGTDNFVGTMGATGVRNGSCGSTTSH